MNKLIFITLFPFTIFAQENFLEDLIESDYKKSKKNIKEYKTKRVFNYTQKELQQRDISDILNSGTIPVAVNDEAQIVNIKTGQVYTPPKGFYAEVHKKKDFEGYRYIKSKNNKPQFKIRVSDMTILKEMLSFYEKPLTFTPTKKKIDRNLKDNFFNYRILSSLAIGQVSSPFLNSLVQKENPNSILAQLESGIKSEWEFPITVSLQFYYQFTNTNDTTEAAYSSFGIGSGFHFPKFSFILDDLETFIKVQSSMRSKVTTTNQEFDLRQANFKIGFNKEIGDFHGKLNWGMAYQKSWYRRSFVSQETQSSAILFSIEHKGLLR